MKTINYLLPVMLLSIFLISCNKDDDNSLPVEANTVTNLHAPQTSNYTTNPPTIGGDFIKFDFSQGEVTTSETDWDIAFRGTTLLVNGGTATGIAEEPPRTGNAAAYLIDAVFSEFTQVTVGQFIQDASSGPAIRTGSGNGWYTYDQTTHIITPTAGKVIVFRTADDHYAKVEILSYYYDSDTSNEGQYYTFNYSYQPNQGVTNFGL